MADRLLINEIFHSIQGESTYTGLPCVFIRLRGCHLRCAWCDTEYAFTEGRSMTVADVVTQALGYATPLVQITGGEPLLQAAVHPLMTRLCDAGRTILLETSGACDISACDPRVIRIMDLKAPASGESHRNDPGNIDRLQPRDQVKIVIADRADFDWALEHIHQHDLASRVEAVLLSPAYTQEATSELAGHAGLEPSRLAEWMLETDIPARLQLQQHKSIWDPRARGV
jgi:7-carboxy-7-deazaguanine synthase